MKSKGTVNARWLVLVLVIVLAFGAALSEGAAPADPVVEHGMVTCNHNWTTVTFSETFTDPIVVCGPPTRCGSDPVTVRVRNVTAAGFQVRIQEWDYLDGGHVNEFVHWMAVERGAWDTAEGNVVAGSLSTSNTNVLAPDHVDLPVMAGEFIVLAQVMTANDPGAVVDRVCDRQTDGFDIALQVEEAKSGHGAAETVGYVVVPLAVKHLGGVTCSVKITRQIVSFRNTILAARPGQCLVRCEAEKSVDPDNYHDAAERVGYIVFGGKPPVVADSQTCNGADPFALRLRLLCQSLVLESGVLTVNHNWQSVDIVNSFLRPVVIMGPPTRVGGQPCVMRVRNVTATGFEVRLQEWNYLDGWHLPERVRYVVVSQGSYVDVDDTHLLAEKWFTPTRSFAEPDFVGFSVAYDLPPVVIGSQHTANGASAITERFWNIQTDGFNLTLQEEEAENCPRELAEVFGFLAAGCCIFEDDNGIEVPYAFPMTFGAEESLAPSWRAVIQEEQSQDTETTHADETINYLEFGDGLDGPDIMANMISLNDTDTATLRAVGAAPVSINVAAESSDGVALLGQVIGVSADDKVGVTALSTTASDVPCPCAQGTVVSLVAPPSAVQDGEVYAFDGWVVDGVACGGGAALITVKVEGEHTAVAVYVAVGLAGQ